MTAISKAKSGKQETKGKARSSAHTTRGSRHKSAVTPRKPRAAAAAPRRSTRQSTANLGDNSAPTRSTRRKLDARNESTSDEEDRDSEGGTESEAASSKHSRGPVMVPEVEILITPKAKRNVKDTPKRAPKSETKPKPSRKSTSKTPSSVPPKSGKGWHYEEEDSSDEESYAPSETVDLPPRTRRMPSRFADEMINSTPEVATPGKRTRRVKDEVAPSKRPRKARK